MGNLLASFSYNYQEVAAALNADEIPPADPNGISLSVELTACVHNV